jgi:hypothetical protein
MSALTIRDDISSKELRRWAAAGERQSRQRPGDRDRQRSWRVWIRPARRGWPGMDRQTLRDWVHRYNEEGIAGLCNRPARTQVEAERRAMAALKAVVLAVPIRRWAKSSGGASSICAIG